MKTPAPPAPLQMNMSRSPKCMLNVQHVAWFYDVTDAGRVQSGLHTGLAPLPLR